MIDAQNQTMNTTSIKGVILDVDGTLVDSNHAHADCWYLTLRRYGFQASFDKIRSLIGMGGDNFLPAAVGVEKDSALGKQIAEERSELFKRDYLAKLKPFPNVPDLLQHMKATGLHLIAGSSSQADELEALLKIAGAVSYLEAQVSAENAERSKPDPDIVHTALSKLGLKPSEVLMIGDTPYDIEAASKAGVQTIAFRCGGWNDNDLKGATAIYDSPADLLSKYQTSPLALNGVQTDAASD